MFWSVFSGREGEKVVVDEIERAGTCIGVLPLFAAIFEKGGIQ